MFLPPTKLKDCRIRHPMFILLICWILAISAVRGESMPAAKVPSRKVIAGLTFATAGDHPLKLDLHLPQEHDTTSSIPEERSPLIIWVHGGAWRMGSRSDVPVLPLTGFGVAIASVDYRLSTEAQFPAQIHDIHAAIRFMRSHAADYGIDESRIVIAGASAGGHLAALTGLSPSIPELLGDAGSKNSTSSDVRAIVSFFGASNLNSILAQSTAHGLSVRVPALQLFLGGQPNELPDVAKLASPVTHVSRLSPPILMIHGNRDPQMPFEQSVELLKAYRDAGVSAELTTIDGGLHGGPEFFNDEQLQHVSAFLHRHLKLTPAEVSVPEKP
jgi:acetyl esterase/lipase